MSRPSNAWILLPTDVPGRGASPLTLSVRADEATEPELLSARPLASVTSWQSAVDNPTGPTVEVDSGRDLEVAGAPSLTSSLLQSDGPALVLLAADAAPTASPAGGASRERAMQGPGIATDSAGNAIDGGGAVPNRWLFSASNGVNGHELWISDGTTAGTMMLKDIAAGAASSMPAGFTAVAGGRVVFSASDASGNELWVSDGTAAGTVRLLDIHPGLGSSSPTGFFAIGDGRVLFLATDPTRGQELWITDGTVEGTLLLRDINTGADASLPQGFTRMPDGRVLFAATDVINGQELWITDGTVTGTALVRDINVGAPSSTPQQFVALPDGRMLFVATTLTRGQELWVTNGTSAGTVLVKDIAAGEDYSFPLDLTPLPDGRFVFTALDLDNGLELWVSDGTATGTVLLKDINPGFNDTTANDGAPGEFHALPDGRLLFSANSGLIGRELWITDGTTAGTVLLKELHPGLGNGNPNGFHTMADGRVLFRADNGTNGIELWITDGTSAGTSLVKDIATGAADGLPEALTDLPDGRVLFVATTADNGRELWVTDGTAGGTVLLKDLWPGSVGSNPVQLTPLGNGTVLFAAADPDKGIELWTTDGTAAGTQVLRDVNSQGSDSFPGTFMALGDGRALFSAADPVNGRELWVTDGTTAGTQLLGDLLAGNGGGSPAGFTALGNGQVLFTASDATRGTELWVTDGTVAGTSLVRDINPGLFSSDIAGLTAIGGGRAVFAANEGDNGQELWVTDGTAAGTTLLRDIAAGELGSNPSQFVALGNGRALFRADNGTDGIELWSTDGTAAGTTMVGNIQAGSGSSMPAGFVATGDGRAVFAATGVQGTELWVSDGTAAGTLLLRDVNPGAAGSNPAGFVALGGGKILFTANSAAGGLELWVTDGSTGGTTQVLDINAGVAGSSPQAITALGDGRALFTAISAANGREVWVTDGTAGGTALLADIQSGTASSNAQQFTALGNGLVVFRASESATGSELWVTDGSAGGTALLADIHTGTASSNPFALTAIGGGRAVFGATTGSTGSELWVTDGTAAGTFMLRDIAPGTAGSGLSNLTVLGNGRIVFSASDGNAGRELWVTDGTTAGTQLLRDINLQSLGSGIAHLTAVSLAVANGAPVGTPTAVLANSVEDAPVVLRVADLLQGFSDPDSDTLGILDLTSAQGSLVANGDGTFTFTPMADFAGTVTLTYSVTDGNGGLATATQGFQITSLNDAPAGTASAALPDGAVGEPYVVTLADLLTGFNDVDGDVLGIENLQAGSAAVTDGLDGTFTITPAPGYAGPLTLTYAVVDGNGGVLPASLTLSIGASNKAPVGSPTAVLPAGAEDQSFTFTEAQLLEGFTDPEGDSLSVVGLVASQGASIVNLGGGTFQLVAPQHVNGTVTLSYGVSDGNGNQPSASLELNLLPVNDAPVVAIPLQDRVSPQAQLFTYQMIAGSFADVDAGDTLTLSATLHNGAALPAWLNFDPAAGLFSGQPGIADRGGLLVRVTATDSQGAQASDLFVIGIISGSQFTGTSGAETLAGTNAAEWFDAQAGNDSVRGAAGNDILFGRAGNDTLDGGADADLMIGGFGNDSFIVDHVGDVAFEDVDGGFDTVTARVSYTIGAHIEALVLGPNALDGTGNAQDNTITGNTLANTLRGEGGNDSLVGLAGADTLIGGIGNDTYSVESAGDVVIEAAGEGIDTVVSLITYTLPDAVENLTLTGNADLNGTGNDLANTIIGNGFANLLSGGANNDTLSGGFGNDTLDGGSGVDRMEGSTGNDTFIVDDTADVVVEAADQGNDTVLASASYTLAEHVEVLTLTGTQAIDGTGNDRANMLTGNSADNRLDGAAGNDTLTGADGADRFVFGTALAQTGIDVITDFAPGIDQIVLRNDVYTAFGLANALVPASMLLAGAGVTAAVDADDFLLFNTTDGALYYDADATGGAAAVRIATLQGPAAQALSAGSFYIESVAAPNLPPTGSPSAVLAAGQEDTPYTFDEATLLQGFTDTDGGVLAVTGLSATAGAGTLLANGDGTWTFSPTPNFNGVVTLSYAVVDGQGGTLAAQQTFTLAAVNDTPIGPTTGTLPGGTEETPYTFTAAALLAGFSDADGDALSVTGLSSVSGTIVDNGDGSYTLTPLANVTGSITLSYRVVDGNGGSINASQTLVLANTNDAPTIGTPLVDQIARVGSPLAYQVAASSFNDIDPGDVLTYTASLDGGGALPGWLSFDSLTRSFAGTPDAADTGGFFVRITATDSAGASTGDVFILSVVSGLQVLADGNANQLVGTADADLLDAQAGNDSLIGGDGNDVLFGRTGDDTLEGGDGNDVLIGGNGVDVMTGGAGDDTYGVNDPNDVVIETAGAGFDIVRTGLSHVLTDHVEGLWMTGSQAVDGTGNAADNRLIGNAAANRLAGKAGSDTLTGGLGADLFVFDTPVGDGQVDTITDFTVGTDRVILGSGVFSGLGVASGFVSEISFRAGAGAVESLGADDRLLFDTDTGILRYDADGAGGVAAVQVAVLQGTGLAALSAGSFIVETTAAPNSLPTGPLTGPLAPGVEDTSYALTAASLLDGFTDVDGDALSIVGLSASTGTLATNADGSWTLTTAANFNGTVTLSYGVSDGIGQPVAVTRSVDIAPVNDLPVLAQLLPDTVTQAGSLFTYAVPASTFSDADGETLVLTARQDNGSALPAWLGFDGATGFAGTPGTADTGGLFVQVIATDGSGAQVSDVFILSVISGESFTGNSADDTRVGTSGADLLDGQNGNDNLNGGDGNDVLFGRIGNDTLIGGEGNDLLIGGNGDDLMDGGAGDDTYSILDDGDQVVELDDGGFDTVRTPYDHALQDHVEAVQLTGELASNATGNDADNVLRGNSAGNRLAGGLGNDTLTGGAGADRFVFDRAPSAANLDTVTDFEAGADTLVFASGVFSGFGASDAALADSAFVSGAGASGALTSAHRLILDTDSGALYYDADGLGGTDAVQVAVLQGTSLAAITAANVFIEFTPSGNSAPAGSATAVLAGAVEDVAYTFSAAALLEGFSDADGDTLAVANLSSDSGSLQDNGDGSWTWTPAAHFHGAVLLSYDVVDGEGGSLAASQTFTVTAVNDRPVVAAPLGDVVIAPNLPFSLALPSGAFSDVDAGAVLSLSAGQQTGALPGWLSFDAATGVLSGLPGTGDRGGWAIRITATDEAGASVSDVFVISVTTSALISGTTGDDAMNGTGSPDRLDGGDGNDSLSSLGGHDVLFGGAGDDTLNGGGGSDLFVGGTGNDTYIVDNLLDVVLEDADAGIDIVRSTVSFTLTDHVENLTLAGNATIGGTGNALANVLVGNGVANALSGGAGNDTLDGAMGNDTLTGGRGADWLTGGGGADRFVFDQLPAAGEADTVTDLLVGTDRIVLNVNAFTGLGNAGGSVAASMFIAGNGVVAALDADDRLIFDTATGELRYDADGAGAAASATLVATLLGGGTVGLSAATFLLEDLGPAVSPLGATAGGWGGGALL